MTSSRATPGLSVGPEGTREMTRALAEELPVAIVFDGATQAVMMASPADLEDFAFGFAVSEGFIDDPSQVRDLELVHQAEGIEARFWLQADRSAALAARRRSMAGPVGCGLCGVDSLTAALRALPKAPDGVQLGRAAVTSAMDALRARQPLHDLSRAAHAAGFVDASGALTHVREDVGRHNALDKLIGALWQQGQDLSGGAVVLTSRVSVEMVQKTAHGGGAIILSASAPTALAQRLAQDAGLTLASSIRDGRFELFSHPHRIRTGARDVA